MSTLTDYINARKKAERGEEMGASKLKKSSAKSSLTPASDKNTIKQAPKKKENDLGSKLKSKKNENRMTDMLKAQAESRPPAKQSALSGLAKTERPKEYVGKDGEQFTKAETGKILGIADFLDLNESASIMDFGLGAQQQITAFCDVLVEQTKQSFIDEAAEGIHFIVDSAKSLDLSVIADEDGFATKIFAFVKTKEEKIIELREQFDNISNDFTYMTENLDGVRRQLLDKADILDQMYDDNITFYKDLCYHVAAGEIKLDEAKAEVEAMKQDTSKMNDPFFVQEVNDLQYSINRLESKLQDLQVTKISTAQSAPQLRMIQTNNERLADKIQSTAYTIIPLWQKQFASAMAMVEQNKIAKALGNLSDYANQSIRENADIMKLNAVELVQELSKGPVDIETLQYVNERLLETIDETFQEPPPEKQELPPQQARGRADRGGNGFTETM